MIERNLVTLVAVLATTTALALAGCKQSVVAGSNDGGAAATSSSTTSTTTTSSSTGSGPADPAVIAAETCAKRAACETVAPDCVAEYTCYYAFFRQDLWPVVEPCFSACGSFDECFYGPADDVPPPASYGVYEPKCATRLIGQCGLGDDWCDYNCLDAADYDAMTPCLELPCDDIVDCFRTVAFADAPVCTNI